MKINNKWIFITCVFLQFDINSKNPNYFICAINNVHEEVVYLNTLTKDNINPNSDLQILANNGIFISDFLQNYYQFYGSLYEYDRGFGFEGWNVLVVRKTFEKGIQKDEESIIIPFINPDPLHKYQNDNENLSNVDDNISNVADNLLCLRIDTPTNLLEEVATKAFLPNYPNEKINWNKIPLYLRSQID